MRRSRSAVQRRFQRFEVIEQLGGGAMGAVYRARDPQLERDVAIKVLARPAAAAREALSPNDTIDLRGEAPADELLAEARLMARLSHPNVLPVYEVGLADDQVFVVMERIAGTDLRRWLETPRSTRAIRDAFVQAGRGLAAAHAEGIVHRDFKPENVLVGDDGRVRVADFGLSRLGAAAALVSPDEPVGGTPYYMAPELWNGAPASERSDVFAFSTAVAEAFGAPSDDRAAAERALRSRGLEARVRAVVLAGLAEDPQARPSLPALLAALDAHGRRRAWWIAVPAGAAAAATAAIVVVVVATASGGPARSCAASAVELGGPWEPARVAALAPLGVAAELEERRVATTGVLDEVCGAELVGKLTAEAARQQASCVERRVLELDARATYLLAHHKPGDRPQLGAQWPRECTTLTAPPRTAERAVVAALYARFVAAQALPVAAPGRTEALVALERDARAAGERELEGRAAESVGMRQIETDDLKAADAALGRSYEIGIAIRDPWMVVTALMKRAVAAQKRAELPAAQSYARLALELVGKPETPPDQRVFVYHGLAMVEQEAGQPERAIEHLRNALAVLAADPQPDREYQESVKLALLGSLIGVGGHEADALRLAHEHLEASREMLGEHDADYGIALNVVAYTLRANNQPEAALDYRKRALAVMAASLPAEHSGVIAQRANVAMDLDGVGRFEDARRTLAAVLVDAERNEASRVNVPGWHADLGAFTFNAGHHAEGLRLFEQGVDELVLQLGQTHREVLDYGLQHVELELELGRIDDAARRLDSLERSSRTAADAGQRLANIDGILRARLELARRRPAEAERRTRAALRAWPELRGSEDLRVELLRVLGLGLADQQRWAEALEQLDLAAALSRTLRQRAERGAGIEALRARCLLGLGRRAEARDIARRARAVLEAFPGELRARAAADAVLR